VNFDRNPLVHKNLVLTEDDAMMLFNRAQWMVSLLARELIARDEELQLPLLERNRFESAAAIDLGLVPQKRGHRAQPFALTKAPDGETSKQVRKIPALARIAFVQRVLCSFLKPFELLFEIFGFFALRHACFPSRVPERPPHDEKYPFSIDSPVTIFRFNGALIRAYKTCLLLSDEKAFKR